jgi:hypothetical protein
VSILPWLDLVVLALALPVFAISGLPMVGYAAAAGAWIAQRAIELAAQRRVAGALERGDRRSALGVTAGAMLGRVWLVALVILLVGLLAEREDGLAAAVLAAVLMTCYLIVRFTTRLFGEEQHGP